MSWNPKTQRFKVDVYRKYTHPKDRWTALRVQFFASWKEALEFTTTLTGDNLSCFRISYALHSDNWFQEGSWLLVARQSYPGIMKLELDPETLNTK